MATLTEQYRLSQCTDLKNRVAAAIVRTAASVRVENSAGMQAGRITKRQELALEMAKAVEGKVGAFAHHCANNATIQSRCDFSGPNVILNVGATEAQIDTDIQYVVSVSWDVIAGVTAAEMA